MSPGLEGGANMSKKPSSRDAGNKRLNGTEASILRRLANGDVSVATMVEGLGAEGYTTDESVGGLLALQRDKKLTVQEAKPYSSLGSYAWSPLSLWFWAALGAVMVSLALISVTSGVALYLRYVFGSVLVLFLPGYALIEALYPKRELDELTRFALSIGLSLALVPLTGLVLNYTPFGIRLLPVAISLAGLTIALLIAAIKRKYDYYKLSKGIP
jgi:hypothetical protein